MKCDAIVRSDQFMLIGELLNFQKRKAPRSRPCNQKNSALYYSRGKSKKYDWKRFGKRPVINKLDETTLQKMMCKFYTKS